MNEYLVGGNHDDDKSFSVFELLFFSQSGLCFKCLMSTPFYNYQPHPFIYQNALLSVGKLFS
jgi:hypothetical protein